MTHDQIDRMVRRANPLSDPSVLTPVDAPVLTTERKVGMQTDTREAAGGRPQGRGRGPLIGIAVAAVILIAGLVFVTRDKTPVAEPAPNAAPIPGSFDAPVSPGAYFVDTDGDEASTLRGTFVIEGSGWTSVSAGARKVSDDDFVGLMIVEVDEVYETVCEISGRGPVPAGSTAAELANQFAAFGFTVQEALAPVSAFGHEGHHLLVEVPEACSGSSHMAWTDPVFAGRYYQDNGQVAENWFLDVEGTPVMVEAFWFPSSPEEDVAELRAVLDTLVITP
jgi:hypothetical protein